MSGPTDWLNISYVVGLLFSENPFFVSRNLAYLSDN